MSAADSNRSSAAAEAADWYARLRAQDLTEMDGLRFRAWLGGSAENRREFEALERVWRGIGALEQSPAMRHTRDAIIARRREAARPRARRMWAIAATTLLTLAAGSWYWLHRASNVYVTDVGELRTVPLSDGSIVTLNTATEVRLDYSDSRRRIELLRGQASFEVAKDPARPFIVSVGNQEVRALGTVFEVYKAADKVTVTLLEGKVAVSPLLEQKTGNPAESHQEQPADKAAEPVILNPGEQISYLLRAAVIQVPKPITIAAVDVPRVSAWRARKLSFRDTLLPDAIAEANRYSKEQIVLEAPGMETARLSGQFEAGKNELFAEGLRTFFGLEVEHRGDDRIILSRVSD
jgi:transmembrane sensor